MYSNLPQVSLGVCASSRSFPAIPVPNFPVIGSIRSHNSCSSAHLSSIDYVFSLLVFRLGIGAKSVDHLSCPWSAGDKPTFARLDSITRGFRSSPERSGTDPNHNKGKRKDRVAMQEHERKRRILLCGGGVGVCVVFACSAGKCVDSPPRNRGDLGRRRALPTCPLDVVVVHTLCCMVALEFHRAASVLVPEDIHRGLCWSAFSFLSVGGLRL